MKVNVYFVMYFDILKKKNQFLKKEPKNNNLIVNRYQFFVKIIRLGQKNQNKVTLQTDSN